MNAEQSATPPQQQFEIQKVYLKDVSLEVPNSPSIFTEQWKPEINLQINTSSSQIAENIYNVTLTLTVTAKLGEKTAYLVEIQQSGIFTIKGFPNDHLGAMLGAFCPNILFPFGREAIASLVQKSGFPPLVLNPVNFDALYLQQLEAKKKAQQNTQQADN